MNIDNRTWATLLVRWAFRDGGVQHIEVLTKAGLVASSDDADTIVDAMVTHSRCAVGLLRNGKRLTILRWENDLGCFGNVERFTDGSTPWVRKTLKPALNMLSHLDTLRRRAAES